MCTLYKGERCGTCWGTGSLKLGWIIDARAFCPHHPSADGDCVLADNFTMKGERPRGTLKMLEGVVFLVVTIDRGATGIGEPVRSQGMV